MSGKNASSKRGAIKAIPLSSSHSDDRVSDLMKPGFRPGRGRACHKRRTVKVPGAATAAYQQRGGRINLGVGQ